jgi:UDP-glucuronate decarboxylase
MEALEGLARAASVLEEDLDYMAGRFGDVKQFHEKKIVLTGGGGFVGYYLTHFFAKLGKYGASVRELLVLDLFAGGVPAWLTELEEQGLPLAVRRFDVSRDRFDDVVADADYVLHMASIASPIVYRQFPLLTLEANVLGLRNLLEACRSSERSFAGILFFSSSEVYGDPHPDAIPTPETYNGNVATMGPRACYDESKRFGETLCSLYHQVHGLPLRIVRPFNNYGPGLSPRDGRVLADFAKAALEGRDLVIHSDGSPTRTYCYIADAIVGYLKVLTNDTFDVFNIGADEPELSVTKLASLFAGIAREDFGRELLIRYERSADADYLTDNPQRRLEEGIRRYLRSLRGEQL